MRSLSLSVCVCPSLSRSLDYFFLVCTHTFNRFVAIFYFKGYFLLLLSYLVCWILLLYSPYSGILHIFFNFILIYLHSSLIVSHKNIRFLKSFAIFMHSQARSLFLFSLCLLHDFTVVLCWLNFFALINVCIMYAALRRVLLLFYFLVIFFLC